MRGKFAGSLLFIGATASSAVARPVNGIPHVPQRPCEVANADALPVTAGSAKSICDQIEGAIAATAPAAQYHVSVRVLSPSRLSAILVVNGRSLPEQSFAVMDRELNPASIARFAVSLAAQVARAEKE